ncbi:response regulator (plasmid) [Streptomyces sp. BI20]|uniref:response regulator n=1 Tax=Streptomyces sp. BI20 TaxID=3403460 RepID=UPI003C778173
MLVASAADMEVVAEAGTGREALDAARTVPADLIVMDIHMPEMDGIEATRLIAADEGLDGLRILILTTWESDENLVAALRAGASGFVVKDTLPADLLAAMRTVSAGESLLSPSATSRLIAQVLSTPPAPPAGPVTELLSAREREVLTLVGRGLTNTEIGASLALSPLTAKKHVSRIMARLGARDRPQLVIAAYESGLITARATPPAP